METSEASIRNLFDRAFAAMGELDVELILAGGHCTIARFANNYCHQNTRQNRLRLSIRGLIGKKSAAITLDDFSDQSLKESASKLRQLIDSCEEDPELLPLPSSVFLRESPGRWDSKIASMDLSSIETPLKEFFAACEQEGKTAAGKVEFGEGTIGDYSELYPLAMANSKGLFAFSQATWWEVSATVYDERGSGWAANASHRHDLVDVASLFKTAMSKARLNRDRVSVSPGEYTVILEPAALWELFPYLVDSFNALKVDQGRSFVCQNLNKKLFPDWVTLMDDAYDPRIGGSPFDGESMPVQKVPLIENGVIKQVVNTRALAKKLGSNPTGHGGALPNPYGAHASNAFLLGGNKSLNEIVSETDKAILITRLWYSTPVNEKKLLVSGMTRDGTFLVENGEIVGAINNMRFNQNLIDLFNQTIEVGESVPCFGTLLPSLKVEKFHFSGTSPT